MCFIAIGTGCTDPGGSGAPAVRTPRLGDLREAVAGLPERTGSDVRWFGMPPFSQLWCEGTGFLRGEIIEARGADSALFHLGDVLPDAIGVDRTVEHRIELVLAVGEAGGPVSAPVGREVRVVIPVMWSGPNQESAERARAIIGDLVAAVPAKLPVLMLTRGTAPGPEGTVAWFTPPSTPEHPVPPGPDRWAAFLITTPAGSLTTLLGPEWDGAGWLAADEHLRAWLGEAGHRELLEADSVDQLASVLRRLPTADQLRADAACPAAPDVDGT